ncbi:acyclic terpene utilization AtuA family protein [Vallitalea okinawensis]|uniref:acyclic terpene utilization AtuA family protein n=1 Tax=Vallitalea okinawensis TaxID=2078660 RepID=UPI000CFB2F8B|nr:acyclic terpene utilization AtuA family protein [Vallitalea okinawensis]
MSRELRILAPTAILGYGFPEESFLKAIEKKPHVISVDAGSTDPGPYYLGVGKSFTDRQAVKRDLELMIQYGLELKIPVIVGTSGGSGAKSHLKWTEDIILEIAKEKGFTFKMAVIPADIEKSYLKEALAKDKIIDMYDSIPLSNEEIDASTNVVAQMGIEPIVKGIEGGADVIITGRAYDPTVFAALPIKEGYNPGLAFHLGKILECACIASEPGSGSDCMMGYLHDDDFEIEPLSDERKCTTLSVSAHTLYEKTDPYRLPGPGGLLDLTHTKFEQVTDRRVRVSGSVFHPSEQYTVKLEGAKSVGYRTVSIAGTRDEIMIRQIDDIIEAVKARTKDNFRNKEMNYKINFIIYGKNGVMGNWEVIKEPAHELGIIIDVVGDTSETANTICSFVRSSMLHYGYNGRISTAGNLAFPFSPSDFSCGEVYNFNMYHLLKIDDPTALFPVKMVTVGGEQ